MLSSISIIMLIELMYMKVTLNKAALNIRDIQMFTIKAVTKTAFAIGGIGSLLWASDIIMVSFESSIVLS